MVVAAGLAAILVQLLTSKPKEGISLLAHLVDRAIELHTSPQEGAGPQLEGILAVVVAAVAADSQGQAAQSFMLFARELTALLHAPRHTTRRLVMEIVSTFLQSSSSSSSSQAGPALQACSVAFSALVRALSDRDAGLRAKALGGLEKHAALLVTHCSTTLCEAVAAGLAER